MADLLAGLQAILASARADGTRSSALAPLHIPLAILVAGCILAVQVKAPMWLIICLVACLAIVILLYCFAYVFFSFKDRDALRSETYSLRKLEIKHGLLGDDRTGLKRVEIVEAKEPARVVGRRGRRREALPEKNKADTVDEELANASQPVDASREADKGTDDER